MYDDTLLKRISTFVLASGLTIIALGLLANSEPVFLIVFIAVYLLVGSVLLGATITSRKE